MSTAKALVPEYMTQFQCIGSTCEDSCCIGWKVVMDKKTYQNLSNVPHKQLRETFKNGSVKREQKVRTDDQFAMMKMDAETGCCSMLNEQKLCNIHASIGENYLAPICATYPRNIHYVNEQQEISAVMSCPEAARLALLNPDKMAFTYVEPVEYGNALIKANIFPERQSANYMGAFWPIRIFVIEILQSREFSFPHRMLVLGLFCEQLQQLISQGMDQEDKVQDLIERFKIMMTTNEELRNFDTFPTNSEFQFITLNNIVSKNLNNIGSNERFRECIRDYLEGMNPSELENRTEANVVDRYDQAYMDYYKPFMDEHEHIFENYAVNFMFSHLFPKNNSRNVFKIYTILVSHYVLMKLLLIGMSAKHQGLTAQLVVKLIQTFTKTSEHSNQYVDNILEFLTANQYGTVGHMSLLIKNGLGEVAK